MKSYQNQRLATEAILIDVSFTLQFMPLLPDIKGHPSLDHHAFRFQLSEAHKSGFACHSNLI